jgi:hypothetical protein
MPTICDVGTGEPIQPVAGAEAHGVSRWKYIAQNPIAALMRIH